MHEFLNSISEQMKPKFHETTAYLTALTCGVLFAVHPQFREIYFKILSPQENIPTLMILGWIATIGFVFSLIHVFVRRNKSVLEKTCVGVFIMGANGLAGILAGIEMLPARWSILVIIPIWNILMGLLLIYQIGLAKFDVSDENASLLEVLGTSLFLFIIFAVVDFGFHLTWVTIFSICLFYSSTIIFLMNWAIYYFRFGRFAET